MIRLISFQVQNCFGFIDSGEVNLDSPENIIYILGRNSSGKTSLLKAMKYFFAPDLVPQTYPRFKNYNSNKAPSLLRAKFSLDRSFSLQDKLTEAVEKVFDDTRKRIAQPYQNNFDKDENIKNIKKDLLNFYKMLAEKILESEINRIWLEKDSLGFYKILFYNLENASKEMNQIQVKIHKQIARIFRNNQYIISNSVYESDINFMQINKTFFLHFPQGFMFDEEYKLDEDISDRIDENKLEDNNNQNAIEKALITYLGKEELKEYFESNDPDDREELRAKLNKKIKIISNKIDRYNEEQSENNNENEKFFDLVLHDKQGIQISVNSPAKNTGGL